MHHTLASAVLCTVCLVLAPQVGFAQEQPSAEHSKGNFSPIEAARLEAARFEADPGLMETSHRVKRARAMLITSAVITTAGMIAVGVITTANRRRMCDSLGGACSRVDITGRALGISTGVLATGVTSMIASGITLGIAKAKRRHTHGRIEASKQQALHWDPASAQLTF